MTFPDFRPAPNQGERPDLYELENDFEAVLRLEFPSGVADTWLAGHPDVPGLSYGYALFAVSRDGDTTARSA